MFFFSILTINVSAVMVDYDYIKWLNSSNWIPYKKGFFVLFCFRVFFVLFLYVNSTLTKVKTNKKLGKKWTRLFWNTFNFYFDPYLSLNLSFTGFLFSLINLPNEGAARFSSYRFLPQGCSPPLPPHSLACPTTTFCYRKD